MRRPTSKHPSSTRTRRRCSPGEIALHRDGAYVGRGRLKLVATGDTVDLGFGADDKVKVTRVPVRRRETEPSWIGQTKADVSEFKTTVKNLHTQPMRITITDRIPFSEQAAITVELLRETTPPTERQIDNKRGVMAWSWRLRAGRAEGDPLRLPPQVAGREGRDLRAETARAALIAASTLSRVVSPSA